MEVYVKPYIFETKELRKAMGKNEAALREEKRELSELELHVKEVKESIAAQELFAEALNSVLQGKISRPGAKGAEWFYIEDYKYDEKQNLLQVEKISLNELGETGGVMSEECELCDYALPIVGHSGLSKQTPPMIYTRLYVLCTQCLHLTCLVSVDQLA